MWQGLRIGLVLLLCLGVGFAAGDLLGAPRAAVVVPAVRTPSVDDGGSPGSAAAQQRPDPLTYKFLLTQSDHVTPVRWNPCHQIRIKLARNGFAAASETRYVMEAWRTLGRALGGVRFVDVGATDVVPDTVEDAAKADADVVVAFARYGTGPQRSTLIDGIVAGKGGFSAWGRIKPDGAVVQEANHGAVVIDAGVWKTMTRHQRQVLYLHEFAHVMGLDHPADSRQIMTPGAYDLPVRYQAGDLAGLAQLGRQAGCLD